MLVLGRIVAPHGVRGEVRLKAETDRPEILADLPHLYVNGNRYGLLAVRPHKNVYCLTLAGVTTREAAEALVGAWVEMPREELPPRPEGQYYLVDLIGLRAETPAGEFLGTVEDILQPGANDVFVIRGGERGEILLPALKRFVHAIDLASGRLVTDLPEWEGNEDAN